MTETKEKCFIKKQFNGKLIHINSPFGSILFSTTVDFVDLSDSVLVICIAGGGDFTTGFIAESFVAALLISNFNEVTDVRGVAFGDFGSAPFIDDSEFNELFRDSDDFGETVASSKLPGCGDAGLDADFGLAFIS